MWVCVTVPETLLHSRPTRKQGPAIGPTRLLRAHPSYETALTYGGWKVHRGRSLGDKRTETQNQGLQARARGEVKSLLWGPTHGFSPDHPRLQLTISWGHSRKGVHPQRPRCLVPASVSHARKRARFYLVWEPDRVTGDADKEGSGPVGVPWPGHPSPRPGVIQSSRSPPTSW